MARIRRSKKEVIVEKIEILNEKIAKYQSEIESLNAINAKLKKELTEIQETENRAAEEAKTKEVLKFIKTNHISVDDLKEMISAKKEEDTENGEEVQE